MTAEQILRVQHSFASIAGRGQSVGRSFYERLFEIDPSTRPLFRSDVASQGAKLMAMLSLIVEALDDIGPLVPGIEQLARRHVAFGVAERHYASVGAALLWTLRRAIGKEFTPDVRAAWVAAYGFLSTTMIAAARAHAVPAFTIPLAR